LKFSKNYFAEMLGTFALVFCGTGAIIINEETQGVITHLGIAMTFGLIVLAMIYTFGEISGAHFNPAVTLGFAVAKRFPTKQILPYILSQIIGAVVASLVLHYLFPKNINLGATLPSGTQLQSFILEFILTYFLMLVIIHVAHGSKEIGVLAGIAIGSMVGLEALFAGPICGASMNPVRSAAPAIISGNMSSLWIYIIAPILGAIAAALTWKLTGPKSGKAEGDLK
jgi:aquaporin NIP